MKWTTNPFFHRPHPPPPPPESDIESLPTPTPTTHHSLLPPTPRLTPSQALYIFVLDGLGAAILSGAINFALAYAMYATASPSSPSVRLWALPNTLAGDAAVTVFLQNLITWCIELVLVNRDLARGAVAPIGFLPLPKGRLLRWFFFMDRTEGDASEPGGWRHWGAFWASQVVRALVVSVGCFVVVWPVCVGVLVGVGRREGGDWVFGRRWAPEVFKLVLGAVLGGVTTPGFVVFWLARAGWAVQVNEGRGVEGGDGGEGVVRGEGGEGAVGSQAGRASDSEETVVDGGQEGGDLGDGALGKK